MPPLAKIYYRESVFDETRLKSISEAVQQSLMDVLEIPPEDFYQLFFALPNERFLHTRSYAGMKYTDEMIIIELTFTAGRDKQTWLRLHKALNHQVVERVKLSPDDVVVILYETPVENLSLGQGEAQRASKSSSPP